MPGRSENDNRPNPDQLLTLVQKDQKKQNSGKLKIFLGMAAGVGKTYAMLTRAQQLRAQGVDIVVGWIDTHGRKETEALTHGLETLPRLRVSHRNVELEELDLDAVLARKPAVVVIDELAHSNAPGLRHEKRYLDVLEILQHGIDVYTAVNIQHLESRIDTVREITGVTVAETVPDSILDEASEIALIDLAPEDLLIRLKEGRIYQTERAEAASRGFFTIGNLTALRELALRTASDRVDRDLRDFKTLHGIEAAWKSSSRLLVAVFGSPFSNSLIRWTRQLADTMKGTWVGVYVDTGRRMGDREARLLKENTELVRKLGGDFVSIQDTDLVDGILHLARQQNVTQIIVGKSQRAFWWNLLNGGSVVHRLLQKSGDIDVYAVATQKERSENDWQALGLGKLPLYPWGEVGWVISSIMTSWLVAAALEPWIGYESIGILFLFAVTLSAMALSRRSVFVMAVAFSLIHNFFFIPPIYTLQIDKPQDALLILMYFIAASTMGHLTSRLRTQNRLIQNREDKAVLLFNLAHSIAEAPDLKSVARQGVDTLAQRFQADVALVFFSSKEVPSTDPASTYAPDEKEIGVARWVKDNGVPAGKFTDTLPSSASIFFPLQTKDGIMGALGLRFQNTLRFDEEARNLAQALIGQIASGLERERLHESKARLSILEKADWLYQALFDSVSHELKTPLTTIKGAASMLRPAPKNPEFVEDLSTQIEGQSERLLEVVENMLDMTRIESGALKPVVREVDVADILGPTLAKIRDDSRKVELHVESDLPPLQCDVSLVIQSLVNILRNAFVHNGPHAAVKLTVKKGPPETVHFTVQDSGAGLSAKDLSRIFDRFYRGAPNRSGGVGLGLSIAKGFIEAQGGKITAQNAPKGGALFTIELRSAS